MDKQPGRFVNNKGPIYIRVYFPIKRRFQSIGRRRSPGPRARAAGGRARAHHQASYYRSAALLSLVRVALTHPPCWPAVSVGDTRSVVTPAITKHFGLLTRAAQRQSPLEATARVRARCAHVDRRGELLTVPSLTHQDHWWSSGSGIGSQLDGASTVSRLFAAVNTFYEAARTLETDVAKADG